MMTICWACANAVPDEEGTRGCSWSREGRPVEGWVAERRDILVQATSPGGEKKRIESYQVITCPAFVPG